MRRLLLLVSLLPIIAAFTTAHFLGIRSVRKTGKLSFSMSELLEKLKSSDTEKMISFANPKMQWAGNPVSKAGEAQISEKLMDSKSTSEIAKELNKIGLALVHRTHAPMVKWRIKVIKAGYYLPPFVALIVVFGALAGRLPMMWAFIAFLGVIGGCCVMLWLSRAVAVEAAESIIFLIEKKRLLPRLREEEELVEAIRAWAWVSLIPGIVIPLMTKPSSVEAD